MLPYRAFSPVFPKGPALLSVQCPPADVVLQLMPYKLHERHVKITPLVLQILLSELSTPS